jgi:hypothetical protein
MGTIGGAVSAVMLARYADAMHGFGDIAFVSAVGAFPGLITGACAALGYRRITRWKKGTWVVAFAAGLMAGGISLFGYFCYIFSNMGD